uniref:lipase family alpha/beta hydrolase n=1 Tax=Parerythrobacter lutipelagi TaxID=1964208 RepID=UPI0010F7ACBF|nr:alpha/beta fold hydrolase [Parerythrobacter lutipelagi]
MAKTEPKPLKRYMLGELRAFPKVIVSPVRSAVASPVVGSGQPVMVIPGMLSGDSTVSLLRRSVAAAGFDAHASGIRFHTGADLATFAALEARIDAIARGSGRKVTIVGWSLGGLYARVLAQHRPDSVAMVVSLGSPFSVGPRANRAWPIYNLVNGHTVDDPPLRDDVAVKPPVHTVAAWSRRDGVISVESARGKSGECDEEVEMTGSHLDLGTSAKCVRQVIDILGARTHLM